MNRPRSLRALTVALLSSAALAACVPPRGGPAPRAASLDSLYQRSIVSAAVYRAEDLRPLNPARPDAAGKVRVVTFTSYPGYANGADTLTLARDVWVTMVPEVRDSCAGFGNDLALRLNQLLGLPPRPADTLMVEMTVPADSVFRPVADPAITTRYPCGDTIQAQCGDQFPAGVRPGHVRWMADNLLNHWRIPSGYPWTRLGYTYNWHPGAPRYGASEYVVRAGTLATAKQVYPVRAYCRAG